jgi:hypothetical protein
MRRVLVQYRVKPENVVENEALVRDVFAQLERERPSGVHYATFKLADGVSFVHVALLDVVDGVNPLTSLSAFKAFSAGVKERCDELPVTTELTEIGSFGLGSSSV